MEFSHRKLPKEWVDRLYRISVSSVEPFAITQAPVYVYLKGNEKFVAVKGPLDFFTPQDLEKYRAQEYFYLPEFIQTIQPLKMAAQKVKELLNTTQVPYELSNEVLQVIGPLWWNYPGEGTGVEPFLVTIFVEDLCEKIPQDLILRARERSVEHFERAIYRSSWAVFLALHLGYCDLGFINRLRLRVYEETAMEKISTVARNEVDELIQLVHLSLQSTQTRLVQGDFFRRRIERVSQKFTSRFERIRKSLMSRGNHPPSIAGEGGFIDV